MADNSTAPRSNRGAVFVDTEAIVNRDSVDKIVERYFAVLTRQPFEFKGKQYLPKPLIVSPLLLRDYSCPIGCGGCCPRFTLDYLPTESKPVGTKKRAVPFDGREISIYTDFQDDSSDHFCNHLDKKSGRCGIYTVRPFSCDFELIRPLMFLNGPNRLTQKLFGRGHAFLRIDGERGALCEMTPITPKSIQEVVRKLSRLCEWAGHFGIETWANQIISLIERGRLTHPIELGQKKSKGFGIGS